MIMFLHWFSIIGCEIIGLLFIIGSISSCIGSWNIEWFSLERHIVDTCFCIGECVVSIGIIILGIFLFKIRNHYWF